MCCFELYLFSSFETFLQDLELPVVKQSPRTKYVVCPSPSHCVVPVEVQGDSSTGSKTMPDWIFSNKTLSAYQLHASCWSRWSRWSSLPRSSGELRNTSALLCQHLAGLCAASLLPLHPAISVTPAWSGGSNYLYTILITMWKGEKRFRMHCSNTSASLLSLHHWSYVGMYTSTGKIYLDKYFCLFLIEVTQDYRIIETSTYNHARKWWSRERSANEEVHLSVEGFDTNCEQEIGEKLVNWSHHWRDQIAVNQ